MDELALRDINAPVLLRFPDILDNRIEKTASCFHMKKESDKFWNFERTEKAKAMKLTPVEITLAKGRRRCYILYIHYKQAGRHQP